jgi:S1-C subfamily serine protease
MRISFFRITLVSLIYSLSMNVAYSAENPGSSCKDFPQKLNCKNTSKNTELTNPLFENIELLDWRKDDSKIPLSKPVLVKSDFEAYYAVFDRSKKTRFNAWTGYGTQVGLISRWKTDELSIYRYKKIGCNLFGCTDTVVGQIDSSVEISINGTIYKIFGENGNFSISSELYLALQNLTDQSKVSIRLSDSSVNDSVINEMNSKTIPSLKILYSIKDPTEKTSLNEKLPLSYPLSLKSEVNLESLIKKATQSVVKINMLNGSGSGFIISPSGLILTNRHVVTSVEKPSIELFDGSQIDAKVLYRDRLADVALLKINSSKKLVALPLCYKTYPNVGENVLAIGFPQSFGISVTRGIVSGIRESQNQTLIQTDAPINPGNSGGPLLNQSGEVIGIVNSKISKIGIEGLGFAVSIIQALNNTGLSMEMSKNTNQKLNSCGNLIIENSENSPKPNTKNKVNLK